MPWNLNGKLAQISLGNLGHAKSICAHQFLKITGSFPHKCSKGKISELKQFGLLPVTDESNKGIVINDYCSDYKKVPSIEQCTNTYVKKDELLSAFDT